MAILQGDAIDKLIERKLPYFLSWQAAAKMAMATHTDTVCAMQVDEQRAAGRSEHRGNTYYFCSQECKRKFDQNPQQYARPR
jgi:Uncharacterized conserved protein